MSRVSMLSMQVEAKFGLLFPDLVTLSRVLLESHLIPVSPKVHPCRP